MSDPARVARSCASRSKLVAALGVVVHLGLAQLLIVLGDRSFEPRDRLFELPDALLQGLHALVLLGPKLGLLPALLLSRLPASLLGHWLDRGLGRRGDVPLLAGPEVVVEGARVVFDAAVVHDPELGREAADESSVVADEEQGAVVGGERIGERFGGLKVEVVRRLVHQQYVPGPNEDLGEGDPRPLTAGEHRDALVDRALTEEHGPEHLADALHARAIAGVGDLLEHRAVQVEGLGVVLGEVPDVRLPGQMHSPRRGLDFAGQDLQ